MQVFVIHRSVRKDREQFIQNLSKTFSNIQVLEAKVPLWESTQHNVAVRGCSISHLSAVKAFLRESPVLILEDDAVIIQEHLDEFNKINVNDYPKDAGVILLGGDVPIYSSADENGFREVFPKYWGTQAVLYLPKLMQSPFLLNAFEIAASTCLGRSPVASGLCYESIILQALMQTGLKIYRPKKMVFTTAPETISDSTEKPAIARTVNLVAKDKPLGFNYSKNSTNGLVTHSTPPPNIGDDIQSISFAKLMPDVGVFIDRENISPDTPLCKTIIGGWYKHNSKDWPPNKNINPLFISFHVSSADCVSKHVDYLKQHEPIGCRDMYTVELCKSYGIDAYFSGCVTSTLNRPDVERTNDIVVVDCAFPKNIPHVELDIDMPFGMSTLDRLRHANERLEKLASAKCVVTTRLHTALPCLAMGIPCLFILFRDFKRFTGLSDMFYYLDKYDEQAVIDFVNNPPQTRKNEEKFQSMRKDITERINKFYEEKP